MSLVKYLLQRTNVDVNKTDDMGYNCAYHLFHPKCNIRSIIRGPKKAPRPSKFLPPLISHGLNLAHVNKRGESLLKWIIDRRNLPSLGMLDESGSSVMTVDCNGLSPIVYAAAEETGEKVVKYLLKSDNVCASDKIIAANLIAIHLFAGDDQLQWFIKAIEIRNQAWPNFNYTEYRNKQCKDLHDTAELCGNIEKENENSPKFNNGIMVSHD